MAGARRRERTGTAPTQGKLWGGRFAGGPSPELEALSRSTHFDWRLAPYDLAGSRAHARVLHARRPAHRRPTSTGCSRGLDALGERYAAGDAAARTRPTRTCTARSSGCCSSEVGAELGGRLRAGR